MGMPNRQAWAGARGGRRRGTATAPGLKGLCTLRGGKIENYAVEECGAGVFAFRHASVGAEVGSGSCRRPLG